MVNSVRPKAKATPAKPMPNSGYAAAKIALPHPPNTSQKVPNSSAVQRLIKVIFRPYRIVKMLTILFREAKHRYGENVMNCHVPLEHNGSRRSDFGRPFHAICLAYFEAENKKPASS